MRTAILVVARMPVPGQAKTRLARDVGADLAADLAAAALLDTLVAAGATGLPCVVAATGDVRRATRRRAIERALARVTVLPQRGTGLGARLRAAHHDAVRTLPGHRVLQIGMDTPQVTPGLLDASAQRLESVEAVVGPAADGGWWALGVARPELTDGLVGVPMSDPATGRRTVEMLRSRRARIRLLPELTDVDSVDAARRVARHADCGERFAEAVAAGLEAR